MKQLDSLINKLSKILVFIAGLLMAALTVVVSMEVILRSAFNMPITITTELTSIIFPWIVGLTVLSITYSDEHMAIVFFKEKLKGKHKMVLELLIQLIVTAFAAVMLWASVNFSFEMSADRMPVMNFSKGYVYISVAVAFLGILIANIQKIIQTIAGLINGGESA